MTDDPDLPGKAGLLSTATGETLESGLSPVKAPLDASMLNIMRLDASDAGDGADAITLEPWVLYDLRRTGATGHQRLKLPTEVIEVVPERRNVLRWRT